MRVRARGMKRGFGWFRLRYVRYPDADDGCERSEVISYMKWVINFETRLEQHLG